MKRFFLASIALLIFIGSATAQQVIVALRNKPSAGSAWTFKQVACSGNTGCPAANIGQSGTSATATFASALTAGDTVAIGISDTGSVAPNSVTISGTSATGPVLGCQVSNATVGVEANCYYELIASGGETSVTVTFSSAPSLWFFVVVVGHKAGTPVFDIAGSHNTTVACTSCATSNLSLTGSDDFTFRIFDNQNGTFTAIGGGYTFINPLTTDLDRAGAYLMGDSSGAGPTVTVSSSGQFIDAALAFK